MADVIATDDTRLARRIAVECYGVEPGIEPLTAFNNAVFRLRLPGGSKILKLARTPEAAPLRKELMLIELIGRHGIPAPVVEHADGQATLVGRPFFIMANAGDRTVADWIGEPAERARSLFAEMGVVLARIHAITLPGSGDILPDRIVPRDRAAHIRRLHELADWAVQRGFLGPGEIAPLMSVSLPSMAGAQLCHGDFHTVQCIVHGGRIAAVVDWESAWAGNSAIDLAVVHAYLQYYCSADLIDRFLEGYASVRPLVADYGPAYLPVRMAHALGLLRTWHGQGRPENVRRAIELYRRYRACIS